MLKKKGEVNMNLLEQLNQELEQALNPKDKIRILTTLEQIKMLEKFLEAINVKSMNASPEQKEILDELRQFILKVPQ